VYIFVCGDKRKISGRKNRSGKLAATFSGDSA